MAKAHWLTRWSGVEVHSKPLDGWLRIPKYHVPVLTAIQGLVSRTSLENYYWWLSALGDLNRLCPKASGVYVEYGASLQKDVPTLLGARYDQLTIDIYFRAMPEFMAILSVEEFRAISSTIMAKMNRLLKGKRFLRDVRDHGDIYSYGTDVPYHYHFNVPEAFVCRASITFNEK